MGTDWLKNGLPFARQLRAEARRALSAAYADEVDDVLQDAYVAAWQLSLRYDVPDQPDQQRTLLLTLVKRIARAVRASGQRQRQLPRRLPDRSQRTDSNTWLGEAWDEGVPYEELGEWLNR